MAISPNAFWRNGEILPIGEAHVPILSHGLSRGSAFFEVLGIHAGSLGPVAFRIDDHLSRFYRSAELLGMQISYSPEQLYDAIVKLLQTQSVARGLIKLVAYWSKEELIKLVVDQPLDMAIFIIPDSKELSLDRAHPISACHSLWQKLHPNTVPIKAKACAFYLNGYLSRKDAQGRGYDIGILTDIDGNLAEGATESVFIVEDGILLVPPMGGVLDSISRRTVLAMAERLGIPHKQQVINIERLDDADEMFVSSSGAKVVPVSRYENTKFTTPGPVTRKLQEELALLLKETDKRYPAWFRALV